MISKLQIGRPITLKALSKYREFFLVGAGGVILGFRNEIIYVIPEPESPITPLVFDDINVYKDTLDLQTGLFLDHTGNRTFYIDVDRYLQEFDPYTRTSKAPTGFDNIRIEDGDLPLMLLSDGSMLITYGDRDFLKQITATSRSNDLILTVDGQGISGIESFNYIGNKASITHETIHISNIGVIELNGIIPTNLISEATFSTLSPRIKNATSVIGDKSTAISQITLTAWIDIYDNTTGSGGALLLTTGTTSLESANGSMSLIYEIPSQLKGILKSVFVSPEIRDFLPTESEGTYASVWTAGYRIITILTRANKGEALELLSKIDGLEAFDIDGDIYNIQSVDEVDARESLITLINRQTT